MDMEQPTLILIRPYLNTDRDAVMKIAADTAFFGQPIENFLDDRNAFLDAFYSYYFDYEGEHAWVASEGVRVLGFIAGCIDGKHHDQVVRNEIQPKLIKNLLHGKYKIRWKTLKFVIRLLGSELFNEEPNADEYVYPAHLHINVSEESRGKGIGRRLIKAYLSQLSQKGIKGVHLHTTSENVIACHLYEKCGFQLIGEKQSHLWKGLVPRTVTNRCYARLTGDGSLPE